MSAVNITENFQKVTSSIPEHVTLVAVSKTKPNELIQEAYDFGHRDFGENKVQDLTAKAEVLPQDIRWHFIGHLQTNKVKYLTPFVYLIHSVDSEKLLREIDKRARNNGRVQKVLIQGAISSEETKFGWKLEELSTFLLSGVWQELANVEIVGLMGMASNSGDTDLVRSEFRRLRDFRDEHQSEGLELNTLSMGMSGDHPLAIEECSNMVRIGSTLFGPRNY